MLKRLLPIMFWLAAGFALTMALVPHPPVIPGMPPADKFQHMLAFTTLAALAAASFRRTPLLILGAYLSIFGALIEIAQLIPVLHRDSDVLDWVADTIALSVVLLLAWPIRRRLDRPPLPDSS